MKGTSKIKKRLAIILIFLFSINTFAAIVSDNDGSAFVTKAEFDALRGDFNKQIDDYNTSIDGKIDGAIASYLSGMQLATTDTKKVLFSDWESVSCIWTGGQLTKGALAPTFEYPSYNATACFSAAWTNDTWSGDITSFFNMNYVQNIGSRRPIVNGITEDATIDKKNAVWGGIATAVFEGWDLTANALNSRSHNYIRDSGNAIVWKQYFPNVTDGYNQDFLTKKTILAPIYDWSYATDGHYENNVSIGTPNIFSNGNTLEFRLDSNGKQYDHEHIISWSADQTFYGSNSSFTKTVARVDNENKLSTLDKWDSKLNKVGKFNAQENRLAVYIPGMLNEMMCRQVNCTFKHNMGTTAIIPRIGLIKDPFKFSEIKQHADTKSETIQGTVYNATPSDLSRGFQAFFEQKDREVIWDLEFDNDWAGDSGEVLVWVSMSPFDGDPVDTNCIDIKVNSSPTVVKKGKTINKKIRLNWTMPETGLVWLKWRPSDDASVLSTNTIPWETTLKLSSCNTYTIRFES